MSTNAWTWFFNEPENQAYLITERLNATFWQARVVGVYWRCTQAVPPFQAVGYAGDQAVGLSWEPNDWLALRVPSGFDADDLVKATSRRILTIPPTLTYEQDGSQVYEWVVDGGQNRFAELQADPTLSALKPL
jgi:hypothetical protein